MGMRLRLLLSALLAFGSAAPAAAQVRAVAPGPVSVVPSFSPALSPALGPSFGAPALTPLLAPGLAAPSLAPSLAPALAPVPALAASLIPSAALRPAAAAPALLPGSAPAKDTGRPQRVGTSLKDLGRLAGIADAGAASAAFDGAVAKAALENAEAAAVPLPLGAKSVSVVRLHSAHEASGVIPHTPNTEHFIRELAGKWDKIGTLDLRVYRDTKGDSFRAVDLTGRSELAENLPEVQPHEAALIRKIQLHSKDLQLVIREAGKTPDLIVDGVVTEMKSLFPGGEFAVQLAHANEQVLAHATRHRLAPGAAAIDLTSVDAVPVAEVRGIINDYVRTGAPLGLAKVSVYAGKDRRVFVRGKDGLFNVEGPRLRARSEGKAAPALSKPRARFLVPDALNLAAVPDAAVLVREVTEPARRLRAAGIKATVTAYGSARILQPETARAQLEELYRKYGRKPKRPEERKAVYAALQAVEMSKYYEIAREFGAIVAREGGGEIAVVSGGGPGIMEAANRGAFEAGGPSVGYNIILDHEQGLNKYATPGLEFEFENFSTRKMALRHGSMGLVYFPGGFGTMDELFEVLTLMQTGKMPRVPIVLVGKAEYWKKILDFEEFARMGLISPGDLSLFHFADTARAAWTAIVAVPAAL
ncbi:MAG: TIGR00730 family Rossman fold protein [Elusimicrobiota bacterium]|nr:TIGR00730 family Rossman fold protein [Elusimicrobiota bacterium]